MFQGFFDEALPNTLMSLSRIYLQSNLMADATAADPSVGVWEQLHCFFFAWRNSSRNRSWGFPSWLRPGTGLAPTVKGPSPSSPSDLPKAKKKQWSCSHTPTEGSSDFSPATYWAILGVTLREFSYPRKEQIIVTNEESVKHETRKQKRARGTT